MALVSQPSPLSPARQHARALASAGDLAGARSVLERAVELGKNNLSEDDPDVLLTAYELGILLERVDDLPGARRVLEEAYAAGQRRLGDADPLMLSISHGIGVVAEEFGNRHEARKAFGRVAELGPGALGADHWAVARARSYLGHDQNPASVRQESAPQPQPETRPAPVEPTSSLEVSGVPAPSVQPPAPVDQLVWAGPETEVPPAVPSRSAAFEQPTIAQPIITPRVPMPRSAPAGPFTAPPLGGPMTAPPLTGPTTAPTPTGPTTAPQLTRPTTAPSPTGPMTAPPLTRPMTAPQLTRPMTAPPLTGPVNPPSFYQDPVTERLYPVLPAAETQQLYPAHLAGAGQSPEATLPGSPGYPYFPVASVHTGHVAADGGVSSEDRGSGQAAYRKGLGLFAAIAAVLASVIAVAALVFVLANRSGSSGTDSNVPTLGGPPPSDVRLRDAGTEIGITWQDPSDGSVSFMVTMGHPGELLKPVATLGPGQTSYSLSALNPGLNYCFTVIAVYRSNRYATSPQACTSRAVSATPR